MELSEERKQKLLAAAESLEDVAKRIRKITEGNLSQSELARELGLTPQEFNNNIARSFLPYIRGLKILSEDEVKSMIVRSETPLEKLAKDIFGLVDVQGKRIATIDTNSGEVFLAAMKEYLKEREYNVICKIYGFEDGHPKSLEQVGKEYGVTRERIRMIHVGALRKLRRPEISLKLLPAYNQYITTLEELDLFKKKNKDFLEKKDRLESELNSDKEKMRHYVTPLSVLADFPYCWIIALNGNGIYTVGELQKTSYQRLISIAYENGLTLDGLYTAYNKYRIRFCNEKEEDHPLSSFLDVHIEDLGLSPRLTNALRRNGVIILRDLTTKTYKEVLDFRSMGRHTMEELEQTLTVLGVEFRKEAV